MKKLLIIIIFIVYGISTNAQNVTITPGGFTPALTGTYPRLNYNAILALPSPAVGDMAYDLTFKCLRAYNGNKWLCTYQGPNDPPNMVAFASVAGPHYNEGESVAVDGLGNVYITGSFSSTANFNGISKTSTNWTDVFVAKYNSFGVIQWVQTSTGIGRTNGRGIVVDGSGSVYITGYYTSVANFDGITINSAGDEDIFVAKYNSNGVVQWVKSAGGSGKDEGAAIALDVSGSVYVTGYFNDTANFSGTNFNSAGNSDIFVAMYNSAGVIQWVKSAGGIGYDEGKGITVNNSGKVYVTGSYQETATFGTVPKTAAGGNDIFVAKYDPVSTSWTRVQSAGGTQNDFGNGITLDALGYVYITGQYYNTATFSGMTKISKGENDIFVAKYNTNLALEWIQSAGSTGDDSGLDISIDVSGSVYITGHYERIADFDGINKISTGYRNIFVAKYNSRGTIQWVQSVVGTGFDRGRGIAVDVSGKVYFTGYFQNTAIFGNTPLTSVYYNDVFVGLLDN